MTDMGSELSSAFEEALIRTLSASMASFTEDPLSERMSETRLMAFPRSSLGI